MMIELPRWYDLHAHFRQGPIMPAILEDHYAMGCAGILAMPNTKPPVAKVLKADAGDCWSIEEYLAQLNEAGGNRFDDIIVPLYLTGHTTPAMIAHGAKTGLLRAAKYYPPHGTTGADFGQPFESYIQNGVFKTMEDAGVVLCLHGEEHALSGEAYFGKNTNAEAYFYRERLPRIIDAYPTLKIVGEHVTTRIAVETILAAGPNVAATITPQHLLYTMGHLVQGFKHHLYCLPLVKFEDDRAALRAAVTNPKNTQFFAGTDSAPHTNKCTPCGCAAGCYTGAIAPQLYAQGFEEAGADVASPTFKQFLCNNGPVFYGLKPSTDTFKLEKSPQKITARITPDGTVMPLPIGMGDGMAASLAWRII